MRTCGGVKGVGGGGVLTGLWKKKERKREREKHVMIQRKNSAFYNLVRSDWRHVKTDVTLELCARVGPTTSSKLTFILNV